MGDPRKSKKKYVKPKRPFESDRFESELQLIGAYGLRNKKELWRHRTELSLYRRQARNLLALSVDERAQLERELIQKLTRLGFLSGTPDLDDVLDLSLEDVLERRLQTIVLRKGLACSPHHARQLVTHGHIVLDSARVTTPSRLITVAEETQISYAAKSALNDESHPARIAASTAAQRVEAASMAGDDTDIDDSMDEDGEAS
ncbi:MAG: 30S ribosomal protein S4 [Candidatus Thorarchaeota archaeon]|nr:30S ribosomal protein S4 [Candidatus Thorarchaeota archaeon]